MGTNAEDDAFVESVKRSRGSAAELKLSLVNLRAEIGNVAIFVFEGDDDRGVFFSWTRYLDPAFRYEPFTCHGKDGVMKLKQAVDRDASGLSMGVYFFIDRDFDDLRGGAADDSIYMTDRYSVENYLVDPEVLDEVLKIEYHCHGFPAVRARVIAEFERVYAAFLQVTEDVNRRLFVVRRLGLQLTEALPVKIGKLVVVSLGHVERSGQSCEELVHVERDIAPEDAATLLEEFNRLLPAERYRGKFAMMFFLKWLELLALERKAQATDLFSGCRAGVSVPYHRLSVVTLASRSAPPESFREFFDRVAKAA